MLEELLHLFISLYGETLSSDAIWLGNLIDLYGVCLDLVTGTSSPLLHLLGTMMTFLASAAAAAGNELIGSDMDSHDSYISINMDDYLSRKTSQQPGLNMSSPIGWLGRLFV